MQMFAPNFSNQFAYLQWKFDLVFVANLYFLFFLRCSPYIIDMTFEMFSLFLGFPISSPVGLLLRVLLL